MATKQANGKQENPFCMLKKVPNNETLEALKEVEEMKKNSDVGKIYTDVDKMIEDLMWFILNNKYNNYFYRRDLYEKNYFDYAFCYYAIKC